jgi:nitrate/nitrite-specific signal transduction histidine kinase
LSRIHDISGISADQILNKIKSARNRIEETSYILANLDEIEDLTKNLWEDIMYFNIGIKLFDPDKETLFMALSKFGSVLNSGSDIKTKYIIQGTESIKSVDHKLIQIIFRIVANAMSNSKRHGAANIVRVKIDKEAQKISLRVEDDGKGITSTTPTAKSHGISFWKRFIRREYGVPLRISNLADGGTLVSVDFPIRPNQKGM